MTRVAPDPRDSTAVARDSARIRADAVGSRERILEAATTLSGDRRVSMAQIAAAAGVGRSTLYRHFPRREALEQALEERENGVAGAPAPRASTTRMPHRPPGQLGRDRPLGLEVTRVLDEVPPHLVPDQLVAEARRTAGVAVALYVVDIDGSQLLRLAGSEEFPDQLDDPPALGPEMVPEALPPFYERLERQFRGCTIEPLWLRGRVIGLLLCVGTPTTSLRDVAKQGSAALELANDYTDFIEAARRRKPTTPAAEIQQNLFPPRIARVAGAQLAGALLPTYEVGGDWFDFVENHDGAWLAIADAYDTGPTAAGLGAAALGALRAARRSDHDVAGAVSLMHQTVRRLGNPDFYVTALIARWRAATATFSWINCGHPPTFLATSDNTLTELTGPEHEPLGVGGDERDFHTSARQLRSGERLIFVTDGVIARQTEHGGQFGVDGLRRAVENTEIATAAGTALAIQHALTNCWSHPLEDDATIVVLAID
jgi:serine phosphatase RsbU (regulator of sigma subunit)